MGKWRRGYAAAQYYFQNDATKYRDEGRIRLTQPDKKNIQYDRESIEVPLSV